MKKKVVKTNAMRMIEQKKIVYVEHEYEWTDHHGKSEEQPSETDEISTIFKTLVAVGNKTGPIVAVIPGNRELDLKALAKYSQNKKVEMLPQKELEALTGYVRGGCSPIAMKKQFPTYIDASSLTMNTMTVSAGRRGLQVELNPKDLVDLVKGEIVAIGTL